MSCVVSDFVSFHTAADVDSLVRHYCVVFFVPRRLAGSSVARFPVAAFTASSCPPVCPSSIHCVHWTPSYSCYHSHYYHISCEERVVEFCCWSTCCQSNRYSDCCRCHRYWPCLHSMRSWVYETALRLSVCLSRLAAVRRCSGFAGERPAASICGSTAAQPWCAASKQQPHCSGG